MSRATILVAEKTEDYRQFLCRFLQEAGYLVEEAGSAQEASEKLEAVFIDLALVGLRLTNDEDAFDISGLEVAKMTGKWDVPCIVIADSPSIEVIRQALRSRGAKPLAADFVPVQKQNDPQARRKDSQAILDAIKSVPQKLRVAIRILHLSDIHLGTIGQAKQYRAQLEADLMQELKVGHLDYLVISGDLGIYSTKEEYEAAVCLVDGLAKRFGLDYRRIVAVPGNHDVNWDLSEEAYRFISKRRLPAKLPEGCYIPVEDAGVLIRDDEAYKRRFAHFNDHFYKLVCSNEYPLDYAHQAVLHVYPTNRILFLALNSAWEIDHHFTTRAGINMVALANAVDKLLSAGDDYNGWLKIAVWHNPITGREAMNDEFLQQLAVNGFQIFMHGHIHEAEHGFYHYDERRGIHIVGAGTFGAPTRQQVPGIPLQYNLLILDPTTGKVIVETRKKEKPDGAWSADARWGDKNSPVPRYEVVVKDWAASR